MGITNNRDTTRSQSFSYDSLNRIVTADTNATTGPNCWGETYTYDRWANMTAIGALSGYTGCTQESLSVTAGTNNQLSATGFTYDASGNMTNDGVNAYGFNAEIGNKLGGSGKPQQHETNSNTREAAKNKALNEGSRAVEHRAPKDGKPHFHSADAQGNKKPSGTHHNYPD